MQKFSKPNKHQIDALCKLYEDIGKVTIHHVIPKGLGKTKKSGEVIQLKIKFT